MTDLVQSRNQLIGLITAVTLVASGLSGTIAGSVASMSAVELASFVDERIEVRAEEEQEREAALEAERDRAAQARRAADEAEKRAGEERILRHIAEMEQRVLAQVKSTQMQARDRVYRPEVQQWMAAWWRWLAEALEPHAIVLPRDMPVLPAEPVNPGS